MKHFFYTLIFILFSGITANAQNQEPTKPKLVIGIVVDQMRYDYLYKYWDKYGNEGFKKLVTEGYNCKNTSYNYVPTYTGPGHASIYTGTTPAIHGIIANNWFDKKNKKEVYCTEDKSVSTVGNEGNAGKMSPHRMLTTTFGDEQKVFSNKKSKVIGIALKDRGAILPAGHAADAAYWFDGKSGNWITSSYYMKELPQWVKEFNKKQLAKQYLSGEWKTLLPIDQYTESAPDENNFEESFDKNSKPVFPYNLNELSKQMGFELIRSTPWGNTITKDFAIETLKKENLGKGDHTDVLTVSFSSTDYIGHRFGPQSVELEDCYLRLDKDLGEFILFLESWVGKNNLLLFLTADHGAVEVPSYLMKNKIPAGYFDSSILVDSLNRFLIDTYKDSLLLAYDNQQVFLNTQKIEKQKLNIDEVETKIAFYLMQLEGVSSCITASDLNKTDFTDPIRKRLQYGFNCERSGNVLLNYRPGWIEYAKTGTTHGSGYSYDTHVPLCWYGFNIKSGSTLKSIDITDIAPTVSLLLNIPFTSGCIGKPIIFEK